MLLRQSYEKALLERLLDEMILSKRELQEKWQARREGAPQYVNLVGSRSERKEHLDKLDE
jgi:hypothetical protein